MNTPQIPLEIRQPYDIGEVRQMTEIRVLAAIAEYTKPEGPTPEEVSEHYLAESDAVAEGILAGRHNSLCALIGSEIVGMCVWSEVDASSAKIDYVYVDPNYQRKGVGITLLDAMLDSIGDAKTITLTTQSAHKLYKKRGFRGTGKYLTDEITSEEVMVREASDSKNC